ncbi:hypothetical protein QBA38_17565 [Streptomyces stelliscabiei]|uniref:hypothetical protein n=1 Tax=Streptomyces stelliscabiei TaxID=146820 RepID=UPI002FF035FE
MTEPTQPGPYTGPPTPPPPRQGAPSPYATTPPAGHGGPPAPPADPATTADRTSGALLILGALLAIGGSFATLDKSVQYLGGEKEGGAVYENVAKAWSYSGSGAIDKPTSVTQFSGVPLLLGGLLAIAAAVLLLTGRSRRSPLGPAFGIVSAALLLGTTFTVLTDAVNDTQWDGDGRTTTFGPGFYLLTVALLLALGATVTTVLALRGPATAFPGPARAAFHAPPASQAPPPRQPAQPWQAAPGAPGAPVAQPYPSAPPAVPRQPPPPPPAAD